MNAPDRAVAIVWFRRDLRLRDNPALLDAIAMSDAVVGVFCVDRVLWGPAGDNRRAHLVDCLRSLDDAMDNRLVVVAGDPAAVFPVLAVDLDVASVHVAADFGPYGVRRDDAVAARLVDAGVEFRRVGSPYAVDPDTVRTKAGTPYKVFTPFRGAWLDAGWEPPEPAPDSVPWLGPDDLATDPATDLDTRAWPERPAVDADLPRAGEAAAHQRLDAFVADGLADYHEHRDRPGDDATSRLSVDLKFGTLHPRQVLARLSEHAAQHAAGGEGRTTFRSELAWREFYADVLFQHPHTARESLDTTVGSMAWDTGSVAEERFAAWCEGRTGYPIVDAGMRQLLAEGWMHNRVRMIVASFLVKDLHLPWQWGARWFMRHLVDGDLASNQHGWQWTAGTGTDASPFFRIFNPIRQSERFDRAGVYLRRWIPELAEVSDRHVHAPWDDPDGPPAAYPAPIVDHAEEREEALARYDQVRRGGGAGTR